MAKDIHDPILGTLTQYQDGDWEFQYYSDLFNKELTITIEANEDSDKPNERIYDIFEWFHKSQNELREVITNVIFQHYRSVYEEFFRAWGGDEEAKQNVPDIIESDEIWRLISSPRIWIHSEYLDLSITFEATWDPEHGVTVLFKDRKVFKIE